MERAPYPIEIHELKPGDCLKRDDYALEVIAVEHGRNALGYVLREEMRLGRFDPDKARELGVPEGPLWGELHQGETVTLEDGRKVEPAELVGPPRPGRLVVYSGDTRPCESVAAAARGADLLIHEATFSQEEQERAVETLHSTALEAGQVALAAEVKLLALTHLSARFSIAPKVLLEEARQVFADAVVAKDGMTLEVGFRDAPAEG